MVDTPTNNGETANQGTVSNDVSTSSAPVVDNTAAELEQARKDAEQARMRANQLENQLAEKNKADEDAKRKQLEEKEEYKSLYEREKSERERIQNEREAETTKAQLTAATTNLFKDYPTAVVEAAKTTGLSLTEDSESAVAILKEKLDNLQKIVGEGAPTVTSSNPGTVAPLVRNYQELTATGENDGKRSWNPSPMAMESATGGSGKVFKEYANTHPALKDTLNTMRRNAGIKVE